MLALGRLLQIPLDRYRRSWEEGEEGEINRGGGDSKVEVI